nr:MAG TPA: hypothetical protein [Caudoviricetes sp.]
MICFYSVSLIWVDCLQIHLMPHECGSNLLVKLADGQLLFMF